MTLDAHRWMFTAPGAPLQRAGFVAHAGAGAERRLRGPYRRRRRTPAWAAMPGNDIQGGFGSHAVQARATRRLDATHEENLT